MEHKFYTDNFERLLKEKSDEFRMYPSKRVWHSIYNDLHPDRKWPSIAVSLVLVTILFLIGYWNNTLTTPGTKQPELLTAKVTAPNAPGKTTPAGLIQATSNGEENIAAQANPVWELQNNSSADDGYIPGTSNSSIMPPRAGNRYANPVTANAGASAYKESTLNKIRNRAGSKINNTRITNALTPQAATTAAAAVSETDIPLVNNSTAAAKTITETSGKNNITVDTYDAAGDDEQDIAFINRLANGSEELLKPENTETPATGLAGKPAVAAALAAKNKLSAEDRSWIEHYALYNKKSVNRWKGRLSSEIYITPGVSLRKMTANTDYAQAIPAAINASPAAAGYNTAAPLTYTPGLSFEAGAGWSYAVAKNIRLKAGLQVNFTNYSIDVTEINHPVITTLLLNNQNNGLPYLEARGSSLANIPGFNNRKIHNQTSQISLPVGAAVKLKGNDKLQWYAGASVQPAYIFGGKANLISSDHNNYVADAAMLRSWNLNTAVETYIHYKMNGFTLQAGPEFRYQLMSTYSPKYTYNENLYNIGVKVGIVKNF